MKENGKNTDGHGRAQMEEEGLIPKHGGYRNLKTFQLATLIYDVTVLFCNKYIDRRSRTHDQMVQAARSGRQNIAEGSVDSGTSKKIELKLTGVAKGSLEELRLDYEDFLRQRGLLQWEPDHAALKRFRAKRCATMDEFRAWVAGEMKIAAQNTDKNNTDMYRQTQTRSGTASGVRASPCPSVFPQSVSSRDLPAVLAANAALSLLNLCIYLLDRQIKVLAEAFEQKGGFTERLYRRRTANRNQGNN